MCVLFLIYQTPGLRCVYVFNRCTLGPLVERSQSGLWGRQGLQRWTQHRRRTASPFCKEKILNKEEYFFCTTSAHLLHNSNNKNQPLGVRWPVVSCLCVWPVTKDCRGTCDEQHRSDERQQGGNFPRHSGEKLWIQIRLETGETVFSFSLQLR